MDLFIDSLECPRRITKSSVWCNKQKLGSFTAKTSPGSTQMTFGDIDTGGIAPLDGSIAFLDFINPLFYLMN